MPKVSVFANAFDTVPTPMEWGGDLDGLYKFLGDGVHIEGEDKEQVPAFCAAIFPPGTTRRLKKLVIECSIGILDLDDCSWDQFEKMDKFLRRRNIASIVYSSWSFEESKPKFRIVMPLSRPVGAKQWLEFWKKMNKFFFNLSDPQTKDPCRIFFFPSRPSTSTTEPFFYKIDGNLLDVDVILQQELDIGKVEERAREEGDMLPVLTLEELKEYVAKLRRKTSPALKEVAKKIDLALEGKVMAKEGSRDDTVIRVVATLADVFHDRDPESVASFFKTSLEAMELNAPGSPSLEKFIERFEHFSEKALARKQEQARERREEQAKKISIALPGRGAEPYTEAELQAFGDMHKKWIIQTAKGDSFYLFLDGSYTSSFGKGSVLPAAEVYLAPAISAGVTLHVLDPFGQPQPKSLSTLISEYGQVASKVVVDLTAKVSRYDEENKTFYEATCPLRNLEPEYNPLVDLWLQAFADANLDDPWNEADPQNKNFHKLCDWISVITFLERPCSAAYVEATPDAGKSLLASGLARLWTLGGPTKFRDAIANFNDSVPRCPFIFGDEVLPTALKDAGTGEIREFIQNTNRKLSRKFEPLADMVGATRLFLAANNKNLIDMAGSNESLTVHDIEAITQRFFYFKAGPMAGEVLREMGGYPGVNPIFIEGDGIAKHALWLKQTRGEKIFASGQRFMIAGGANDLARSLSIHSGLRGSICHVLAHCLAKPNPHLNTPDGSIRTENGQLYTTAAGLLEAWKTVHGENVKLPSVNRINQALQGLSMGETTLDKKRYMIVSTLFLRAWVEEVMFFQWSDVEKVLLGGDNKPTGNSANVVDFHKVKAQRHAQQAP